MSRSFDHPNVIRVVDSGHTAGEGFPFFVMPHYAGGSLEGGRSRFVTPTAIFNLFAEICDGVSYLHSKGIVHRDIKPANIFLDYDHGIVGDLGLGWRLDADSLTEAMEVAAARWYGAPEFRDGHQENPHSSADVYSLGKLLYWLFTGKVYDREEESYGVPERKLAYVLAQKHTVVVEDRVIHAGAFADDLISQTVRFRTIDRLHSARELASKVRGVISRYEAGGHALDLDLPHRCLFCGTGAYLPLEPFPNVAKRNTSADPFHVMRERAKAHFGIPDSGVGGAGPLILICQHCGHVQQFRFDWKVNGPENWKA